MVEKQFLSTGGKNAGEKGRTPKLLFGFLMMTASDRVCRQRGFFHNSSGAQQTVFSFVATKNLPSRVSW